MDLIQSYLELVKETFTLRNYKRMNTACAVLSAIVMFPVLLSYAVGMLVYGLFLIVHKLVSIPADYLMNFVKGEGKDVQHATQAVMYLIGFPIIFILKVIVALLTFVIGILHFGVSVDGYVAMLGGITFSPFVLTPVDRTKSEKAPNYTSSAVILFVIFGLFLLLLYLFFQPAATALAESFLGYDVWEFNIGGAVIQYDAFSLYLALMSVTTIISAVISLCYISFVSIYTLAFFRRKDNKVEELNAPAEVVPAESSTPDENA